MIRKVTEVENLHDQGETTYERNREVEIPGQGSIIRGTSETGYNPKKRIDKIVSTSEGGETKRV